MTQYLPPNLLALFAARDPIPYLPPAAKLPHEKKSQGYSGVGQFLSHFEDPKDTPAPVRLETREERLERKRRERAEKAAYKLEQGIALWNPQANSSATSDPYKTLFVARINYDTTESKLRREFEAYGPIKKISMVTDKVSGKPRGYAFIEFEHEREMHSAYKHADGKKIDGRRVLVDVERGRTVKGWLPRRLGGGLGGTRKGAPDENVKHSGRDDARSVERDRYDKESHRHSHSRDRSERRRSRSRDREKRRKSKSPKDRDRERDRGDRDRRSRYDRDRRSEKSRSARENVYGEEQAGGDVPEKRRGESRDKDLDKHRKRRRSRSHSRERKRSHRNDYDSSRGDKLDTIKEGLKDVPENGLYDNNEGYDNEPYPTSGYGENSNSSSYDQFAAQNYSQPTYVTPYNTKEDLYSP